MVLYFICHGLLWPSHNALADSNHFGDVIDFWRHEASLGALSVQVHAGGQGGKIEMAWDLHALQQILQLHALVCVQLMSS